MPKDLALRVLKIVSNPIRKSIIESLEETPMIFSDIMRACGLDPNHDTGPFYYHLSILIDAGLVEKGESQYHLTSLGGTVATLIGTLQRESGFLLEHEPLAERKGGKRLDKIEAKWLTQAEVQHGDYGFMMGGPRRPPREPEPSTSPEDIPTHREMLAWKESLPKIEVPKKVLSDLFGVHVLGFEREGVKLGSMHVTFSTGSEVGTERVVSLAKIRSIHVLSRNCREVGETRASVLRRMMEEFTRLAREHGIQTIIVERANAEDEELMDVLKGLDFERYMTTYLMRAQFLS